MIERPVWKRAGQAAIDFAWLLTAGRAPMVHTPGAPTRRGYDFGRPSRLTANWTTATDDPNEALRLSLPAMRARSRDLFTNNPYGRRFRQLLEVNVVGATAIRLKSQAQTLAGAPDAAAAAAVEAAYAAWSRYGHPTVDGRLSRRDLEKLIIASIARDGEFLALHRPGWRGNRWRYALQVLDPDQLDDGYTMTHGPTGNRVVMGVEIDADGRPVAYHIWRHHPRAVAIDRNRRMRVPAGEVIHRFLVQDAAQVRGVPWAYAIGRRLKMLAGYETAELTAARVAAAKMGFLQTPDGGHGYDPDDPNAARDGDGAVLKSLAPGEVEVLPAEWKFEPFDPQHPTTAFGDFVKAMLRGVAAGLGPSYESLAQDRQGVNFSSLRQGALEERDYYRDLQGYMAEAICAPVFEAWLSMALLAGQVDGLSSRDLARLDHPAWVPRGWQWVDPLKEVKAHEAAVALGINSRTRIAAETGRDVFDVLAEQAAEEAAGARPVAANSNAKAEGDDDEDD